MTYAFRDKGEVEVLASASDKKFLRTNITDGLKEGIKLNQINLPLLEMKEVKVFEIGTVFLKDKPARNASSIADAGGEEIHVAYGDKKNVAEITLDEFTKDLKILPDTFNSLVKNSGAFALGDVGQGTHDSLNSSPRNNTFKQWSQFPFIVRDVSVWVPEGEDPQILGNLLKTNAGELLVREPYIFDSFTKPASTVGGEGKTSYAFRLVFQSYERTLTDEEINPIMAEISHKISENSSWIMR